MSIAHAGFTCREGLRVASRPPLSVRTIRLKFMVSERKPVGLVNKAGEKQHAICVHDTLKEVRVIA